MVVGKDKISLVNSLFELYPGYLFMFAAVLLCYRVEALNDMQFVLCARCKLVPLKSKLNVSYL